MKRTHNYLRRFRREKGLTQKEVAQILGLKSSSMISRWEDGTVLPDVANALKIAALYQTSVDSIYEDLRFALFDEFSFKAMTVLQSKAMPYD